MIEIKVTEETTQITSDDETMEELARDLVYVIAIVLKKIQEKFKGIRVEKVFDSLADLAKIAAEEMKKIEVEGQ